MIKDIATAQAIYKKIQEAGRVLVVTHQNPDGDGMGAISALAQYLQAINKNYQLYCRDKVPSSNRFLFLLDQVIIDPQVFLSKTFDLIIVFLPLFLITIVSFGYFNLNVVLIPNFFIDKTKKLIKSIEVL